MKLAVGVLFMVAALVCLMVARPKNGKPRSFVDTSLEVPVVLSILGAFTVGAVLTISGIVPSR